MENLLLFCLSPDVALAYMMKFPNSFLIFSLDSPGVHSSPESCCKNSKHIKWPAGHTQRSSEWVVVFRLAYRRAKVVSNFMCEGDVWHFRWDMWSIVLHSDDTGVERFHLPIRVVLAFFTNASRASCWVAIKQTKTKQSCKITSMLAMFQKSYLEFD